MESSFWFGYKFDALIFPFVRISNYAEFTTACFCLVLLILVYEVLKIIEIKSKLRTALALRRISEVSTDTNQLLGNSSPRTSNMRSLCLDTGIYLTQLSVSYIIMLIVMTYNVYFFTIAVGTSTFAYFFMGQLIINLQFQITKLKKHGVLGDTSSFNIEETAETPTTEVVHI